MLAGVVASLGEAPDLATGMGTLHRPWTVATVDGGEADPLPVRNTEPPPAPGAFHSHHKIGQAGVIVLASGAGAAFVGGVAGAACLGEVAVAGSGTAPGTEETCAAGAGLILLGGLAITTGEVLLLYGAVASSYDLGLSPAVGWVGVGLAIASVPLFVVPEVGVTLQIAGIVLGAVSLGHAGHVGRERQLVLVPTGHGAALAGTF